jgi:hypothetical protein
MTYQIVDDRHRERGSWLRTVLAPPAETVHTYLVPGEELLHVDTPALKAFFVEELPMLVLLTIVGTGATVWGLRSGNLFLAGIALILAGALMLYLRLKRWNDQYTAYVLTTARVMRVSGFFKRSAAWIPWVKVTDVRFEASLMGRLLGYATVYIDSANETSGLSEMRNLSDPRGFYVMLTQLVQMKQGSIQVANPSLVHE